MKSVLLRSWLVNGEQINEIVEGELKSKESSCFGFKNRRQ